MKHIKKNRLMSAIRGMSRISICLFHVGLPLIFTYLCGFLHILLSTPDIPGYVLARLHFDTLEHIIMSATLIIIGGLFFDIIQRSEQKVKK